MRSSKKRSLLIVNEHFESKPNDKVALLDSFISHFMQAGHDGLKSLLITAIYTLECLLDICVKLWRKNFNILGKTHNKTTYTHKVTHLRI